MGSNNFGETPKPEITNEEVMNELSESAPVAEPAHEETEKDSSASVEDLLEQLKASQGPGDALGVFGIRSKGTPIPEIEEELERQIIIQEEWGKKYSEEDINATAEKVAIKLGLVDSSEI